MDSLSINTAGALSLCGLFKKTCHQFLKKSKEWAINFKLASNANDAFKIKSILMLIIANCKCKLK